MKSTAAAIEFGTSKIVTLVGEGSGASPAQLLGFGVEAYDGYSDGHWNAPDEDVDQAILRCVHEAELSSGREIKEVYVGVPGDFIRVEENEVAINFETEKRITPEDVDELMAKALDYVSRSGWVVIHRSPAWFRVDERHTMEPVGTRGSSMRCMASFIVADPTFLEDIQARLEAQSIHINGYLSPSLGQALMLVPPEERDRMAVLIDVGYLSTEVMFVQGDAIVYQRQIPVGGGHITADVAYGLSLTMAMAEDVKRKYAFGGGQDALIVTDPDGYDVSLPKEQVSAVLEPRVAELADMVQNTIERSGIRLSSRSSIYLTGGGLALMRGGREYMTNVLERTVKTPSPVAVKLNSPQYSAALGLLELVYESVSQMEFASEAGSGQKKSKVGSVLKSFFTK